jgi:hypothetical protein
MGRYQSFVRFRAATPFSGDRKLETIPDRRGHRRLPGDLLPRKVRHLMLWTILVILLIVLVVLAIMGRGRFGSR